MADHRTAPVDVVRGVIDALNAGDLDGALAHISPDAVNHAAPPGTAPGLAGWRQTWEGLRAAFPDLRFTIEQSIQSGDAVANRYTMRGTHAGEFMGTPGTGHSFEVLTLDIIRVRDGKVVEHWALSDQLAMSAQLRLDQALPR